MPLNPKALIPIWRSIAGRDSKIVSDATRSIDALGKKDSIAQMVVHNKEQNTKAMKDLIADRGIGTFLDVPVNVLRSLPPVRKLVPDEKYNNFLYGYQHKLIDADRKLGEKLSKGKFLRKLFTTTDLVPSGSAITQGGKVVKAYVPTEVSRFTAPFDKSKDFVIPTLALYGISDIVDNKKSSDEEGGTKVAADFETLKSQLVEKIAGTVQTLQLNKFIEKEAQMMEKAARASELLKSASVKINELESQIDKLAEENTELKCELDQRDKTDKAIKLAKQMLSKRMIKTADYETQVAYITKLSDENYDLLAKTVEDVPLKQNSAGQNGLDKLSYMYMEGDDGKVDKPSLEDAILNFSK
jgi:hypothetical protein